MTPWNTVFRGPVMRAAERALETGNVNYIQIWVPEGSENALKNLLERACCAFSIHKDLNNPVIRWYFATIQRLHADHCGPDTRDPAVKNSEEQRIILLTERACENADFDEITAVLTNSSWGEMRQRFQELMKKREYPVDDIAAGRAYAAAFTSFVQEISRHRAAPRRELKR